jgi:DNA-binding SARP family transcriptional activator
MNKLIINLLGNVEIYYDVKLINKKLSDKSIGILAVLLCNKYKKVNREKLSYMFWPDCFETANYNLRYNLWSIKKIIPNDENNQEFIISDNKYCYINPEYKFISDVTFLDNISFNENSNDIKTLEDVKKLFRGEFLEDFYFKECDDFNDWIFSQRSIFQNMRIKTLNTLLNIYLNIENYHESNNILEEILLINPYDEESHYKLMNLLIKNNESNLAILHYKKYETTLRQDLNIFPQKKIKDLYLSLIDNKNIETVNFFTKKDDNNIVLRINEYADLSIDYFVISDLLEKLSTNIKKNILRSIPKIYLEDACLIQPCFYDFTSHFAPLQIEEIRLYHSVKNILINLSKEYMIQIYVYNKDKVDKKSEKFLKFLGVTTNIFIKYVDIKENV